jgi:hypothetical protein
MNQYLWDKTGSDPEIEALESTLASFRPSVSAPPRIAGEEQIAEPVRGFFRIPFAIKFAMAGAAALLILLGVAGAFRLAFIDGSKASIDFSGPAKVKAVEIPDLPSSDGQKYGPAVARSVASSPKHENRKPRRIRVSTASRNSVAKTASSDPPADQLASLTAEERHAYDQLMLALSITSSRLRMVQDIADGNEGITPPRAGADKSSRSN